MNVWIVTEWSHEERYVGEKYYRTIGVYKTKEKALKVAKEKVEDYLYDFGSEKEDDERDHYEVYTEKDNEKLSIWFPKSYMTRPTFNINIWKVE